MNNPSQKINEVNGEKAKGRSLVESEDTYRKLYEDAPIAYFSIGADKIIKNCNNATSNLLGYTKAELLEKSAFDLYADTPEGLPKARELFIQFLKGKMIRNKELQMKKKNGEVIWISLTVNPIINEKGNIVESRSMVVNITERKKAEIKLEESEERLNAFMNSATENFGIYDSELNLIDVNKAGLKMWPAGTRKQDIIGKNLAELAPNIKNTDRYNKYMNIIKTGKPIFFEDLVPHPIFGNKHLRVSAFRVGDGLGMITIDITERKKAEQILKESGEKYRHLFESSIDGIIMTDLEGRILDCNEKYSNMVGYTTEELKELTYQQLTPEKWHEWEAEIVQNQFISRGYSDEFEKEYIKKDGTVFPVALKGWVIKDENGNPTGMWGFVRDITNRKKAEQKIKESEEKYRTAYNRSNLYKDIFTHDINNILQNILSSLELSKIYSQSNDKKEEFEEVTSLINEEVIRCKNLVLNVRKMSDVEDLNIPMSSIDAFKVLKQTIDLLKNSYPDKEITVSIDASQNEYHVNANEFLNNIFRNIFFNSVTHNRNPIIEISIKISEEKKNNIEHVKFEMTDNGMGIPDSMKKNIFEREYKENDVPSGIGLGLLLVKRILESYKGEINVKDRIEGDYSKGSDFIVIIPKAV